ncbi:gliding motility-associated C-terminal domain-containing protein [Ancylomarina sp. DW003]|nr:gliding motility-associated C-terminal domain-containing protein [Ancylomarina sp. DW003]MDE5421224.1 gliding motility-associated C-terminal domain-containing protein [Ancylomarina sp. DW003]
MRSLVKIAIRLLSIILLLSIYLHANAQDDIVEFSSTSSKTLCPLNNGVVTSLQTSSLEISGPTDKIWYASYSINGGPSENMNGGLGINTSIFDFEISFRNDSKKLKTFTVQIEKAWLEDGTQLTISANDDSRDVTVYPLTKPSVQAYENKIKTNSEEDYTVIIGMNSIYKGELPTGASQMSYNTEVIDAFKYINFRIKWQAEAGITTFKSIEKTGFGCNSDTIYSNIELKNEFSVDLGDDRNICSGETVTLTPAIDLKSEYTYLWSTGETSESIEVNKIGEYELSVTDTRDNQKITNQVNVNVHDSPPINIDDVIMMDGSPIQLDIQKEGCTYLWSTGETSSKIEISTPGDFSVMITSEYGCTNSKSFTVKDQSSFFTLNLPNIIHMCAQETMTLSPYMDIDQEYTYEWSTGSTEREIEISTEGTYTLKATDPNGYSQTASSKIYYHSKPIVDLGDDFILWDGESKELNAQNTGASFKWSTSEMSQIITVNSGGEFWVNVIDEYGCANADTINVDYREGEKFRIELGDDRSICQGDSVLIIPEIIGHPVSPLVYNWVDQNHNDAEIYLKEEGNFLLEVTDNLGNIESAEIHITVLPAPIVNLGEDIIDYPNLEQKLIANVDNVSYNWSTGEVSKSITIENTGTYWVEVINEAQCSARDSIYVKFLNDYPFVGLPKAFSPNGDSHNDLLFVRGIDIDKINLMIYNRLGKKVFETSDINQGWDGRYNGHIQDMDSYYYSLDITYTNGVMRTKTGKFSLLR